MTKFGIKHLLLSCLLLTYLLIAVSVTDSMADDAPCCGVTINILNEQDSKFVTPADIDAELNGISRAADTMAVADFDIATIERKLNGLPNVEYANVYRSASDKVIVDVHPMVPVARVFDRGRSYYINHDGKRLKANLSYRSNVPVIYGRFDSVHTPASVLPMVEQVEANDLWRRYVSAYQVTSGGDILVVPYVTGHLVNFGSADNVADKFDRLQSFYAQVMPVKGWNYYDTISVKFAGQVIATVAEGKKSRTEYQYTDSDFDETFTPIEVDVEDAENLSTVVATRL